ncbi:MAG: hypothetical protein C5B50_00790 [Verrucomicrobia bacterium]|nr:MAG: hypothetical protein C5B50_00790 [Verrucomicrobiota bacterium]
MPTALLDAALAYARLGYRVFPCSPAKRPLIPKSEGGNGCHDATTDPARIRAWWSRWPWASIGIATGPESRLVVVDEDGPQGAYTRAQLAGSTAIDTVTVRTARGPHLWFAWPAQLARIKNVKGRGGLDVRGNGGYVIAPPSRHASGHVYYFDGQRSLAPCPQWVIDWANEPWHEQGGVWVRGKSLAQPATTNVVPLHSFATGAVAGGSAIGTAGVAGLAYLDRPTPARVAEPWSLELEGRIITALAHLPAVTRDEWLDAGMALHATGWGDRALAIWDVWSRLRCPDKGPGRGYLGIDDLRRQWITFKPTGGRTIGTIFARAKERGWQDRAPHAGQAAGAAPSGFGTQTTTTLPPDGGSGVQPNWERTQGGAIKSKSYVNTRIAFRIMGLQFRHDIFRNRRMVLESGDLSTARELSDPLCRALRDRIIDSFGFDPGIDNSKEAASRACEDSRYDPVLDYLTSLRWDGAARLGTWLATYCGAERSILHGAFGTLWMVAAVRRARLPGTKFDHVLVLEGAQRAGKSSVVKILASGPTSDRPEAFVSDAPILHASAKEQQEAIEGVWLYELAELTGIRRAEVEALKAFLSRNADTTRMAYDRFRTDTPRRCVFIGTTNDRNYLADQTGNSRFWPIETGLIDLAALRRDRDQLWAEAMALDTAGLPLVLPSELYEEAAKSQLTRTVNDPWEEILENWRRWPTGNENFQIGNEHRVTTKFIWSAILRLEVEKVSITETRRIASIMNKLGWIAIQIFIDGHNYRGYRRISNS